MKNKILALIIVFAFISIVCALGFYITCFSHSQISNNPADWGLFGDYIGGVLNPLFGFLAFIGLLWTIKLQHDALKLSEETNLKQAEYIERKEKKEEWASIIHHAEQQINDQLQMKVSKNGIPIGTLSQVIKNVGNKVAAAGTNGDTVLADEFLKSTCDGVTTFNLHSLASLFHALSLYLENYQKYLVEKDPEIVEHYVSSYLGYISALQWMGVISDSQMKPLQKLLDLGKSE